MRLRCACSAACVTLVMAPWRGTARGGWQRPRHAERGTDRRHGADTLQRAAFGSPARLSEHSNAQSRTRRRWAGGAAMRFICGRAEARFHHDDGTLAARIIARCLRVGAAQRLAVRWSREALPALRQASARRAARGRPLLQRSALPLARISTAAQGRARRRPSRGAAARGAPPQDLVRRRLRVRPAPLGAGLAAPCHRRQCACARAASCAAGDRSSRSEP